MAKHRHTIAAGSSPLLPAALQPSCLNLEIFMLQISSKCMGLTNILMSGKEQDADGSGCCCCQVPGTVQHDALTLRPCCACWDTSRLLGTSLSIVCRRLFPGRV